MSYNKQNGAASLFIVIFTTLIMVIVTVSFIRIMVSNQQQATANDLSQSAYDSAQAGVEDAKRALLRYQSICTNTTALTQDSCNQARESLVNQDCNATGNLTDVIAAKGTNVDVPVQTTGANSLDQAYTCVNIKLDTEDYVGDLKQDASNIIPLIGVSNFSKIKVEWFNTADMQGDLGTATVSLPLFSDGVPLLSQFNWASTTPNRPPIMRTQVMQFATAGFNLTDFDDMGKNDRAVSSTMFLYPSNNGGISSDVIAPTNRRVAVISPVQPQCKSLSASVVYACSVSIKLPMSVSGSTRTAFLDLKALYKKAHYRITLRDSSDKLVPFNEVQPEVDSTGRANNLFRRVSARIGLGDINFPYPEAAVDTTGNFCKNFLITDSTGDYSSNCNP